LFKTEYQLKAYHNLAQDFNSYHYSSSTPTTSPSLIPAANQIQYNEIQRRQLDNMEKAVRRVQYKLLTITELFHDICLPYKKWDICILLLYSSKNQNVDLIKKFWKSLIYRIVPDHGNHQDSQDFLRLKRDLNSIDIDNR